MRDQFGNWRLENQLGAGGQGWVAKVRRFDLKQQKAVADKFNHLRLQGFTEFWPVFLECSRLVSDSTLGAVKVLHGPEQAKNPASAKARFETEIAALEGAKHSAIVKVLEVDKDREWFVMEYHCGGKLTDSLSRFKGKLLDSIQALRPVLCGIEELHRGGWLHRDIKPDNILINVRSELVLGDAGLAFLRDNDELDKRVTATGETVGSWEWMPIHYVGGRDEDLSPSFDVYGAAKVLWAMISGRSFLRYHYHMRSEFNLEKQFSERTHEMKKVNAFLSRCITENLDGDIQTIEEMINAIDILAEDLEADRTNRLLTNFRRRNPRQSAKSPASPSDNIRTADHSAQGSG